MAYSHPHGNQFLVLCEECQYWTDDLKAHTKVCLKGSMDERALEERRRNNAKQVKKGEEHATNLSSP